MKIKEFKAWLEGYSSSFVDFPSREQWKEIKSRLDKVTGDTIILNNHYEYDPLNYHSLLNSYTVC